VSESPPRELLELIAHRMSLPIPSPARPRPKPAQSWRLLKPGQHLLLREKMVLGTEVVPEGTSFRVDRVNSLGAELVGPGDLRIHLTQPDWKKHWTRQVKKRKIDLERKY